MTAITIPRESPLIIPDIMKAHWKSKEPFHLIGEPSTVKSALVKQTAEEISVEENDGREFVEWSKLTLSKKEEVNKNPEKYFIFEDLRASETDIGELRLQNINNGEKYITYKYNLLFDTYSKPDSKGVLFFDEMNLASNMIKAQFYKVYNDRSIGDLPISDEILICSAGNESSQVRDVVQDSVALTTRRGNYFIDPLTSEEFISYGIKTGINNSILGYLAFSPQDVHLLDYNLTDSIGQPCVRTWEKLSNILNSNDDLDISIKSVISRGLIGPAISTKFTSFMKLEKSIKLEDVIKNPDIIKDVKELQVVYAIVTGLLSKFKQGDEKLFGVVCKVAINIKEEIGVYILRMIKNIISINRFRKLALEGDYKEDFDKCYKKFGDLLID